MAEVIPVSNRCPGCGSVVTADDESIQMPELCGECGQELPIEVLWHQQCLANEEAPEVTPADVELPGGPGYGEG